MCRMVIWHQHIFTLARNILHFQPLMRRSYLYYGLVGLLLKPCVSLNRGNRVWPEGLCLAMRTKVVSPGIFGLCHLNCYDSHEPKSHVYKKQKKNTAVWLLNKSCLITSWAVAAKTTWFFFLPICKLICLRKINTRVLGEEENLNGLVFGSSSLKPNVF